MGGHLIMSANLFLNIVNQILLDRIPEFIECWTNIIGIVSFSIKN